MIEQVTPTLGLPLPHPSNDLADDVMRLRAALTALDEIVAAKANPADITTAVEEVIGAAPEALNTLHEFAQALGDDPNFAATMTQQLTDIGIQIQNLITSVNGLTTGKADASALTAETSARQSADAELSARIGAAKIYTHFLASN